jgi:hypothetical protein
MSAISLQNRKGKRKKADWSGKISMSARGRKTFVPVSTPEELELCKEARATLLRLVIPYEEYEEDYGIDYTASTVTDYEYDDDTVSASYIYENDHGDDRDGSELLGSELGEGREWDFDIDQSEYIYLD